MFWITLAKAIPNRPKVGANKIHRSKLKTALPTKIVLLISMRWHPSKPAWNILVIIINQNDRKAKGKIESAAIREYGGITKLRTYFTKGYPAMRKKPIKKPTDIVAVWTNSATFTCSLSAMYFATNLTTLPENPKFAIWVTDVAANTTDQTPNFSAPIVFSRNL